MIFTKLKFDRFQLVSNSSILETDGVVSSSLFYRSNTHFKYSYQKGWSGVKFSTEHNEKKQLDSNRFDPISQKFQAYEVFTGIGDSTKVFAKLGYIHRVNDSLQNNRLAKVNQSDTYYLDSKWIHTKNTNLSLYANYRNSKRTRLQSPLKNQSIPDCNSVRSLPIISSTGIRFMKPTRDDYPNKILHTLRLNPDREALCGSIIMRTAFKN